MLDNPLIVAALFHPRSAQPGYSRVPNTVDGTFPASSAGIVLGYRFYRHPRDDAPLILFFHGNGEVASDYDDMAGLFHKVGASLLVVDYRGYGWSTGKPLGTALLPDAEAAYKALPEIVPDIGDKKLFVMGRSLGSAPAIHLAATYPQHISGLILDSAFFHAPSVFARLVNVPEAIAAAMPDPFGNASKIATIQLATLIIHGERDTLIPLSHAQRLYDLSPATDKTLLKMPNAGHNDLLRYGIDHYFGAISTFITTVP